jgi:hypothetical protein
MLLLLFRGSLDISGGPEIQMEEPMEHRLFNREQTMTQKGYRSPPGEYRVIPEKGIPELISFGH